MLEAVESSNNGRFSQLQSFGDSSEEELSVLPRHTKVVVTGNNRTKSVLVGLQGVVKKAVGLGGWHWLVLTNGIEVKLQRNALSVIEAPTGNEEDDDLEFENLQWNGSDMASDDTLKSHRSRYRLHKSSGSSYKTVSRSLSCDSQSKGSISTPRGSTKVDLRKLEMAALWRYWRHFNLVGSVIGRIIIFLATSLHVLANSIFLGRRHSKPVKGAIGRCSSKAFYVAANGRGAGDYGVRKGGKETEDGLQMTGKRIPTIANKYREWPGVPPLSFN